MKSGLNKLKPCANNLNRMQDYKLVGTVEIAETRIKIIIFLNNWQLNKVDK